jgi:hypothetical protein
MKPYQTGLLHHDPGKAYPGFTLIAPMAHEQIFLVSNAGEPVHWWTLPGKLGSKAYLLPNGNLLCSVFTHDGAPLPGAIGIPGALGGRMLELDWSGSIAWEHTDPNQHHDLCRLENGHTLYLAREEMTAAEAERVAGGLPGTGLHQPTLQGKMFADVVREVTPDGELAWEWRFKDIDAGMFSLAPDCHRGEWAHANSIAETPDGNILVSFRHLDTIMVVKKAAGEIIWSMTDPGWGHQHNAEMLPNGNITLFANGMNNLLQPLHSRAVEIDPASKEMVWQYIDPQRWTFFSPVMGGVQRLANGNTLISESLNGRVFEVTPDGEMAWDYICPEFAHVPVLQGQGNALFRAYRYAPDSPEIAGRLEHRP